jgi:hypothetical protein
MAAMMISFTFFEWRRRKLMAAMMISFTFFGVEEEILRRFST